MLTGREPLRSPQRARISAGDEALTRGGRGRRWAIGVAIRLLSLAGGGGRPRQRSGVAREGGGSRPSAGTTRAGRGGGRRRSRRCSRRRTRSETRERDLGPRRSGGRERERAGESGRSLSGVECGGREGVRGSGRRAGEGSRESDCVHPQSGSDVGGAIEISRGRATRRAHRARRDAPRREARVRQRADAVGRVERASLQYAPRARG